MLDIDKKIIKIKLGWVGVHPKGLKAFMNTRRKMRQFYCRKTVWLDGGKIKAVCAENIPHYLVFVVLSIQPLLRQSGIIFYTRKVNLK